MKKKKVSLSIVVALLLLSTATLASIGALLSGTETDSASTSVPFADVSYSSAMTQNLSANASAVKTLAARYDVSNLSYEDYVDIESYITFMTKHSLTPDEIAMINSLAASGTTMQTIENIYDFYLTTNEEFSLIAEIAALETEFWGNHWIENAYNHVTNNVHGVLDGDDVEEYLHHVSADDIAYANILSRKGVYTIEQILSKVQGCASWDDITADIYASLPSSEGLTGSKLERACIASEFLSSGISCNSTPMASYELGKILSKSDADISSVSIADDNITEAETELKDTYYDELADSVNAMLKSLGMPTSYMNYEQYSAYDETNRSIALANGMPEKHIMLLEERGYTIGEIAEVSYRFDGNILDIVSALKSERSSAA